MSRSRIGVVLALSAVLPALLLGSCGDRTEGEWDGPGEGTSLVELFEVAETSWQVRSIDLGKPDSRRHLMESWGYEERGRLRDAVWALGERSTMEVFLSQPQDLWLYLDVQRLEFDGLPPQDITVEINGRSAGAVQPSKDFGTPQRLKVPADLWRQGRNEIAFRHSVTAVPSLYTDDRQDGRPLASSWNGVSLRGLAASAGPTAREIGSDGTPPSLHLPYGSETTYHLRLGAGARLRLPRIEDAGRLGGPGKLKVILERDGVGAEEAQPVEWTVDSGRSGATTLDLTDHQGVYRLTLRSLAKPARRVERRGLTLIDPRIVGLADSGPAESSLTPSAQTPEQASLSERPNILLYVVDTLRADHVGTYGYDRGTTPHLDALARRGVVFENARAQSSWTRPTVASMLTGRTPWSHGTNGQRDSLSPDVAYLPQLLSEAGYETAAVITNGVVSGRFGFDRGFDSFTYLGERVGQDPRIHRGAEALHKTAMEWLDGRRESQDLGDQTQGRPFFLYLHATDPHAPYWPPPNWRERFAADVDPALGEHDRVAELEWNPAARTPAVADDLRALYDAEIAFLDHRFGVFMASLRDAGLYEDLVILLISDHGEEFGEHGRWQHGMTLHEEQLRVPLLLKLPAGEGAGQRIGRVVEQMDVAPTLLRLAGADVPSVMQGVDLLQGTGVDRTSSALLARQPHFRHVESILSRGRKLVHSRVYDRPRPRIQLFDLATDPEERVDLADRHGVEAGFLRSRLRLAEILWRPATVGQAAIDEELERSLRAVGYLD